MKQSNKKKREKGEIKRKERKESNEPKHWHELLSASNTTSPMQQEIFLNSNRHTTIPSP